MRASRCRARNEGRNLPVISRSAPASPRKTLITGIYTAISVFPSEQSETVTTHVTGGLHGGYGDTAPQQGDRGRGSP